MNDTLELIAVGCTLAAAAAVVVRHYARGRKQICSASAGCHDCTAQSPKAPAALTQIGSCRP